MDDEIMELRAGLATRTEADAVADIVERTTEPTAVERGDLLIAPHEQTVVDLERYADQPRRQRGLVDVHTPDSLVRYVNAYKDEGSTIYADSARRLVVGVLNDHFPVTAGMSATAGWADHRVNLQLRHSPEWIFWSDMDGKAMRQLDFAEHIERGLPDITDPPGADLLELAQTFEANTSVEFASSHRLTDGQRQLTYKETTAARAGDGGTMEVPETFTLSLAPFEGTDRVPVVARLRYRINDGDLVIRYELVRLEDVVRAAFDEILATIAAETDITPYAGSAPASQR